MPCYDPPDSYRDRDKEIERGNLKKLLNERTDMLCRTLKMLEYTQINILRQFDKDIIDWWESHKRFDESKGKG